MGETTGISWTDHTFNPWWGCTRVSLGCDNCYAETFDARFGDPHWGKGIPRRIFSDKHWREPLLWDQNAERYKVKRLVFCASMADVMDDEAPEGAREKLWDLINNTPHLIWQLLTKRPHRFERYMPAKFTFNNVWLGVSAENQEFYDVRWPILRDFCAARNMLSWISYEPALGQLSVRGFNAKPDWIIFGGESGNNRRPCKAEWASVLLNECKVNGIKFFAKQMSARTPAEGKLLIPEELNVQEFPVERNAAPTANLQSDFRLRS
jgi:protein gp37